MIVGVRTPVAILCANAAAGAARVEALEEEGQPVLLVCLDRSTHEHRSLHADVLHEPLVSVGILGAALTQMVRAPAAVFRALLRIARDVPRPRLAAATLLRLPCALDLAKILRGRGIGSVHGADALSTRIARIVEACGALTHPDLTDLPVDWTRVTSGPVALRWLARRINSIAAEVSLGDGSRVVVKRQRDHAAGAATDRWAHETRVLSTLGQALQDAPYRVPRILLADEATTTVVMERARGTALDALFAAASSDERAQTRLHEGVRAAGAWLAAMQHATRRPIDGRAVLDEQVRVAMGDVAKLAEGDRVIRRQRTRITAALQALRDRVAARRLTVAGHHDDYWPGNIFFDGERVTVIDFESFRDGLPLEDAAFFLIRCDLLLRRFRVAFPDLREHFLSGLSSGRPVDDDALRLFTLTKGLRALGKGIGEDLPLPQRLWTRSTIRRATLAALR